MQRTPRSGLGFHATPSVELSDDSGLSVALALCGSALLDTRLGSGVRLTHYPRLAHVAFQGGRFHAASTAQACLAPIGELPAVAAALRRVGLLRVRARAAVLHISGTILGFGGAPPEPFAVAAVQAPSHFCYLQSVLEHVSLLSTTRLVVDDGSSSVYTRSTPQRDSYLATDLSPLEEGLVRVAS